MAEHIPYCVEAGDRKSMRDRMANYDYDRHHYDANKRKNRKDHVTDPRITAKKAFEKYDKPVVHYAAEAVAAQIRSEKKLIKNCDFASWMGRIIDRRAKETGERPESVSAVITPLVRIFANEFKDIRELVPMGQSKYDYILAEEMRPGEYQWLRDKWYGGKPIPKPLDLQ